MRRSFAVLRYVVFGLAVVVSAVLAVLYAFERTGELAARVEQELARALAPSQVSLTIDEAHLDWFDAGLTLVGVRVGEQGRIASLERVRATFDLLAEGGPTLRTLEVAGGRVTLAEEGVELLRTANSGSTSRSGATLPTIAVEGLTVELEHPELGRWVLGKIDARVGPLGDGTLIVQGRWNVAAGTHSECELYVEGHEVAPGRFELAAWSDGVDVDGSTLPRRGFCAPIAALAPRGKVRLAAGCTVDLAHPEPTRGWVRASLVEGAVRPTSRAREVSAATAELDLHLDPRDGESWADATAWYGNLTATASLGAARGTLVAALGRSAGPANYARGSIAAHDIDVVHEEFRELGLDAETMLALDAFGVGGRGDGWFGFDWPSDHHFTFALECEAKGAGAASYVGFEDAFGERRGFAWPVERASGRVVITYAPTREHTTAIAIIGARGGGHDGVSEVACDGVVRTRPGRHTGVEFDFELDGRDVPIDENLRHGLRSTSGSDALWNRFSPRNGTLALHGRVQHREGEPYPSAAFDVDLHDVDAVWSELPIPCERLTGKLALRFDPRAVSATSFDLAGVLATSDAIAIRGRWQDDPALVDEAEDERHLEALEIRVDNLALKGAQRDVIVERFPNVGTVLDEFGASGRVDVRVDATRAANAGMRRFGFEITPRVVQLAPRAFQVQTRNVRGRVIVVALETPPATPTGSPGADVTTTVAPLIGDWSGGTRVAFDALFPPRGAAELELAGAGLNLQNRALVGAFRQAVADETGGGLDLGALSVDGRIDFRGRLALAEDGSRPSSRYEVYLRENGFQIGGGMSFGLQRLSGLLVQQDGRLAGDELHAQIGNTPVTLRRARFYEANGAYHLEAEPEAFGLPLDREHMRFFLDEDTLTALEKQLRWRGTIDIFDAKLALVGSSAADSRVTFSGSVAPHGMFVDIGLPLEIDAARATIRELVFEQGSVRAWAEIDGLAGRIAERRLSDARMLVTYVEPHLSILALDGKLEGGRIAGLGGGERASGAAFAVDLREPYAFELGLELAGVEVAGLLRGLFESDFANSGKLSGDLRLAGQLDHILGIQGRGRVDIADSRLWSIPVVRDLFAQLGYDKPAVFRRVRSRFEVDDGKIDMQSLYVESPLAQLAGSGSLDLDGRISHDLEVKYGLVDNLGPITRFVYWIQNNLLRVEIRGDMSRPKIVLRGMLSFLQGSKSERRDLPVPSFAPIPERF